mgnify:FL=1
MRCKICELTTKHAGKPSRNRKICGSCWYKIRTKLRNSLNNTHNKLIHNE